MDTILSKEHIGWKAKTIINLTNDFQLKIVTTKNSGGSGIYSSATVHKYEHREGDRFGSEIFRVFHDFNKRVATERMARCTESAVKKLHNQSLARIDEILAALVEHYEAKGEDVKPLPTPTEA
jgi:hypothetical protein